MGGPARGLEFNYDTVHRVETTSVSQLHPQRCCASQDLLCSLQSLLPVISDYRQPNQRRAITRVAASSVVLAPKRETASTVSLPPAAKNLLGPVTQVDAAVIERTFAYSCL